MHGSRVRFAEVYGEISFIYYVLNSCLQFNKILSRERNNIFDFFAKTFRFATAYSSNTVFVCYDVQI